MYRIATNVEPEMCDYASINWSHRNNNEKMKTRIWNSYQEKIQ